MVRLGRRIFVLVLIQRGRITCINKEDSLLSHKSALDIVREILERTGSAVLHDEKELRELLQAIHKGPLNLPQFKRFLAQALREAVLGAPWHMRLCLVLTMAPSWRAAD